MDFGNDANSNDVSIAYLGLTDAFVCEVHLGSRANLGEVIRRCCHDQTVNGIAADSSGNVFIGGTTRATWAASGSTRRAPPLLTPSSPVGPGNGRSCVRALTATRLAGRISSPGGVVSGAAGGLPNAVFIGGMFASSMTLGSTTITTPVPGLDIPSWPASRRSDQNHEPQ